MVLSIGSPEHPSCSPAFPADPAGGSRVTRTHGQGGAVTPQSLSLPSSVLPSCVSPTLPSLMAGSPSLFPGTSGSAAPFCPSPGYHRCINPSQAISCQLCLILPALSDRTLSLSSPALHPPMKRSQCWFPVVLPCLYPIPCQRQHFGEPGCLFSSSSFSPPASSLSPALLISLSALGLG